MEYKIKAVLYSMGGVEYKISYCMAIYKGTFWSKIAISIHVQRYTHEKVFLTTSTEMFLTKRSLCLQREFIVHE